MHGHTHKSKHRKNTLLNLKELQYRQSGEEYAIVNCDKGSSRFEVTIYKTSQIIIAKARGSICKGPRKQRLEKGDYILIIMDETTSSGDKYYIVHKYSNEDIKKLRKEGELTQIRETKEDRTVSIVFEDNNIIDNETKINIDDDFISNL
jgi:hypothetical protein